MPTLLKANVTTAAGGRFVAAVANLTPTGLFLRTAEALHFRDKLTITLLGFSIPAEVLFVSGDPAGVVVALATPFEARKALESRARTVEVLEAPDGPGQLWEEDTANEASIMAASASLEISDLAIPAAPGDPAGVDPWNLPEPVTSNQAAMAIDESGPLALSGSKITPIVESAGIDSLPAVDSVRPMSVDDAEPSSDVDVPIDMAVDADGDAIPPTGPLDTGPLVMAKLHDSIDLVRAPEPEPAPPPAPVARTPSAPSRAPSATRLQVIVPPPPGLPALAPVAAAAAAPPPTEPPTPPVADKAPPPPPTPLPRSESLPVVDPTLPDLDGDLVRFTSREHFALQFRSNLKQGGLVVRARSVPIGTQRLLALAVPGLDNYTVSARVVFSEPGKLGFMLDSFNLHKVRLQQMAELPTQAST